ncbi:cell division protein ZapA [Pelagibius sp. CAU 1746]|uniref:cell division protein ZapA n=1 Tax=Pelagibius sp. CAU 1746 TaxID=3140370 RepID=UPI00325B7FD8
MAQISLTVHGRSYQVTCDDGQESHLLQLAEHIDAKMTELEGGIGQVGEQRLLFMSCLLIADELFDAQRQVDGLKAGRPAAQAAPAAAAGGTAVASQEQASRALDACAQRIEAIAARLQGA